MGDEESRHARVIHSDAHSVARDPRLAYLEDCTSDLIAIANTDLVVRQTLHGEVFPELAVAEVIAAQVVLPVPIRLDLVHEYRPLLAAVARQVALPVSVDVESSHELWTVHGVLPDGRMHGSALPDHVPRLTYVHRQNPARQLICHYSWHSSQVVRLCRCPPRRPADQAR